MITLRSYRYRKTDGRGHVWEATKSVLVDDSGSKWLYVLMMAEGGLAVLRVPKTETQYMQEIIQSNKVASMSTIIKRYRAYGKRVGTTKAATSFLHKASLAA